MSETNNTGATPKKSSKKKLIFLGLGLAVTGVLSYFGFEYWKKHKQKSTDSENNVPEVKAEKPSKSPGKPKSAPKQKPFPKGTAKTNDNTVKKDPAEQAPPKEKETKDKPVINTPALAKEFLNAAVNKQFIKIISLIRGLKNTSNYNAVNAVFSTYLLRGVRQTLVTGLLGTFKLEAQKKAIRMAFVSIGLKYDGKKFSLSGVNNKPLLITTSPTKVWKNPKTSVAVPLNMVLGREVDKRGTFTLFENESQFFLVESKHVNYYKA